MEEEIGASKTTEVMEEEEEEERSSSITTTTTSTTTATSQVPSEIDQELIEYAGQIVLVHNVKVEKDTPYSNGTKFQVPADGFLVLTLDNRRAKWHTKTVKIGIHEWTTNESIYPIDKFPETVYTWKSYISKGKLAMMAESSSYTKSDDDDGRFQVVVGAGALQRFVIPLTRGKELKIDASVLRYDFDLSIHFQLDAIDALDSARSDKDELVKLRNAADALDGQISERRSAYDTLKAQYDAKNVELTHRVDEMRTKYTESLTTNEVLSTKILETSERIATYEGEIGTLKTMLEGAKTTSNIFEQEIATLRTELDDATRKHDEAVGRSRVATETDRKTAEAEIASLRKELADATEKLDQATELRQRTIMAKNVEVREALEKIRASDAARKLAEEQIESHRRELVEKDAEIERFRAQLQDERRRDEEKIRFLEQRINDVERKKDDEIEEIRLKLKKFWDNSCPTPAYEDTASTSADDFPRPPPPGSNNTEGFRYKDTAGTTAVDSRRRSSNSSEVSRGRRRRAPNSSVSRGRHDRWKEHLKALQNMGLNDRELIVDLLDELSKKNPKMPFAEMVSRVTSILMS